MMNGMVRKCVGLALLAMLLQGSLAWGQGLGSRIEVSGAVDNVEIITGSSRRLTFPFDFPEVLVENPEILTAVPIRPNEIIVRGLKPGITTISVMTPSRELQTVTVQVVVDVRKLERAIQTHYPDSNITVHALQTGVILKGTVAKQAQLTNILAVAQDYFPSNVINEIGVGGAQLVAIKVKIYEVSRTKLRTLGIDWAYASNDFGVISSVSDLITNSIAGLRPTANGQNFTVGVVGDDASFDMFFEAIERRNIAKLLTEPILVAEHGRPAEFLSGGEIPIPVQAGLGTTSIEFRPFGTKLDIVPLIQGQGEIKLEVRAEVSERASDLSNGTSIPGFRVRRVNTSVSMMAGHSLVLAGDFREESETEQQGVPKLMDSPLWGPFFRRNEDQNAEQELVFVITPRFVGEVDPGMLPARGPGQFSDSPSDYEFYHNGHLEVPICNDDCPPGTSFDHSAVPQMNLVPQVKQTREEWEQQQLQQDGAAPPKPTASRNGAKGGNGFSYPRSADQSTNRAGSGWPQRRR